MTDLSIPQRVDAGLDLWDRPETDTTQRLEPLGEIVAGHRAVSAHAVAALRHPSRPLLIDAAVQSPRHVGTYRHHRTLTERRDDLLLSLLVGLLWVLLHISDGHRRRVWGETRAQWEARTQCSPQAMALRVHAQPYRPLPDSAAAHDVKDGDGEDNLDVAARNLWAALWSIGQYAQAAGTGEAGEGEETVEPEPEPWSPLVATRDTADPDIAWTLHSGMTGTFTCLTDEQIAEIAAARAEEAAWAAAQVAAR